ncbi:MAG: tetratricopeptide repeat protein [Deltaproteobacteria bacterium]|nr:tetratricopeptide repeat protein [Deltaproteobacteria bacterium]
MRSGKTIRRIIIGAFIAWSLVVWTHADQGSPAESQTLNPSQTVSPATTTPDKATSASPEKILSQAEAYHNRGEYLKALEYYQRALAIRLQTLGPDHTDIADLHFLIGSVYFSLEKHTLAAENYQRALTIFIKTLGPGHPKVAVCYLGMGDVANAWGDYRAALENYQKAIAIFAQGSNSENYNAGISHTNIGNAFNTLGDYSQALEHHQQALAVFLKTVGPEHEHTACAYDNIGNVYGRLGAYTQALENHQQALTIFLKANGPDHVNPAIADTNIGNEYSAICNYTQALSHHQRALTALIKAVGPEHDYTASAYLNLAECYYLLGDYPQALNNYQKSLEIFTKTNGSDHDHTAGAYLGLSRLLYATGDYGQSLEYGLRAKEIASRTRVVDLKWQALNLTGKAYLTLGQPAKAISAYDQALNTIEQIRANVPEQEFKITFMQDKLVVYDEFIELLQTLHHKHPDKGYDQKALEIFERKQGRVFLELMGQSGARRFAGLPDDFRAQETLWEAQVVKLDSELLKERQKPLHQQNQTRINDLEKRKIGIKKDLTKLEEKIRVHHPGYYGLRHPQPVTLNELRKSVLQPHEAILVFDVMKARTVLWVISQTSFELIDLGLDQKALEQEVKQFRTGPEEIIRAINSNQDKRIIQNLVIRDLPRTNQQGNKLFKLLLPEKAQKLLANIKMLYIAPTGPLYLLPFEALVVKEAADGRPPHYLIEDRNVAYLSSASLLKTLRDTKRSSTNQGKYPLLAFAHPVYVQKKEQLLGSDAVGSRTQEAPKLSKLRASAFLDLLGGQLPELPETAAEVRAIKDILQAPSESHPLQLREAAAVSNVLELNNLDQLASYKYLIFSCHGLLQGEVTGVKQPALALSHPDPLTKSDGFLTMSDIFGLKLNADLVTLSACNTGRGESMRGEGVIGLTRAFMFAGTPAISVTLWSVASSSTMILTTELYRNLASGEGKAAALAKAKIKMISDKENDLYRHPYFWAPIVIFGDGQ